MEEEISSSWNKVAKDSKKAGFREGAAAGRETNFQNSFDLGYKEGFRNGFLLGKLKGSLRQFMDLKYCSYTCRIGATNTPEPEGLAQTRRGNCIICKDKSIAEQPINDIINNQKENTDVLIKTFNI